MKHLSTIPVFQNIKTLSLLCLGLLNYGVIKANDMGDTPISPLLERYVATNKAYDFFEFCDTCGCGSSGGSMGYGTGMNNNFIGVRYIHQEYKSRSGIFNDSPWIEEDFNTLQAWGNIALTKRAVLNVIVPYQFHHRDLPDGTAQDISGIGDINILALYNLISPTPDSIISIKPEHYLQIGGGLKLPTGKYKKENNEGSINPSFQLGNGSLDYIAAINYGFSYRNWGISSFINYAIKTENTNHYKFGNQLNYGLNAFKTYYLSDIALTPIIGLSGENYETNQEFNLDVANTKGHVLLGKLSLEATYKKYALGLIAMLPVQQHLNNNKVELKSRTSVYLNFNL